MSFANFYVGENEITKQFKGCYKMNAPFPSMVGMLSGISMKNTVKDIVPVQHTSVPGLWIFSGIDGDFLVMVGMDYKNSGSAPKRVDGRAAFIEGKAPVLNSANVSNYWDNAMQKNVGPGDYSLTISNNAPLKSVNTCLQNTVDMGGNELGVYDVNSSGVGRCVNASDIKNTPSELLNNVKESQCLGLSNATTLYNVNEVPGAKQTLGKTFMGQKTNNKMTFHEYPSELLTPGKKYVKFSGYGSDGGNLANGTIENSSSEDCKQFCLNKGDNCSGFVYDKNTNSCYLKNSIYPNKSRQINKSQDIYTRMPAVKNSKLCPKDISAVNTEFMNKSGSISDNKMSLDFKCETEAGTQDDMQSIEKAYSILTKELGGLREENEHIVKKFIDVEDTLNKKAKEYYKIAGNVAKREKNVRLEQFLLDNKKMHKILSIKNVALASALLVLSIILVRVLRK
jgi:hypothetical protein